LVALTSNIFKLQSFSPQLASTSGEVLEIGRARPQHEANDGTVKGTVKWFNNAKGYGFLGREDGPDVFVTTVSIQLDGYKTLKEGDEVEFDVIEGSKVLRPIR